MGESQTHAKSTLLEEKNEFSNANDTPQWFVMRDLKRCNAKLPAYKLFISLGIEAFTPMVWKLSIRNGKRYREKVPFMQDLLFVHDTRNAVDLILKKNNTVQYRYMRGGYKIPMTVRDADMDRFIHAVKSVENPCYYTPGEISSDMIGKKVRIIGGPLNGYEGRLQKMQGRRIKRLFVELPHILTVSVEVQPEYIQLI